MKKINAIKLDPFEQEIEDNLEKAGVLTSKEIVTEKKFAKMAAKNYLREKVIRINIGVFDEDLTKIKKIAKEDGIPYQTLLTSVIHKLMTGRYREICRE